MCGIVGYIGQRQVVPILLGGLKSLAYRGYDSAGLAVLSETGLHVRRAVGKIDNLSSLLTLRPLPGRVGIGHTRWATHGRPSEENTHPHLDCSSKIAVIHNGIIENHGPLKDRLLTSGHAFRSETDTEVISHLVEEKLASVGSLREALRLALRELEGAYAIAVLCSDFPGELLAAKTSSPLAVGLGEDEAFLASDVPAFLEYTRDVIYLDDGEMAAFSVREAEFSDIRGHRIRKSPTRVSWNRGMAEKAGYRHFMLKEIHEQPRVIADTLRGRTLPLCNGILERETGMDRGFLSGVSSVHLVGCGTAHHAAMVGKYLLERFARIPAQVETASEFRYREPMLSPSTLVIAISQSGETADTLAAARLARQSGCKVLSICNTVGSALTRCADFNFYTHCGPECGVASTKAFVGQLVALSALTLHLGASLGRLSEQEGLAWVSELSRLPELVEAALKLEPEVQDIARHYCRAEHFIYIGRTFNYPTALEGALKLKEISYIHAEGYAAGEMKHGPIALIDMAMPVVAIATHSKVFDKVLSNIEEAKARRGQIIALCTQGEKRLYGKADRMLELPKAGEFLSPIVNVIPLQLLAYHIADLRGCDVDCPRNLAKSVTVE